MAIVGDGTYKRSFAGDTFDTAWHMAQTLRGRVTVGFVTRLGADAISDEFVFVMPDDAPESSGVGAILSER